MQGEGEVFRLGTGDAVRYVHVRQKMLLHDWGLAGVRHGIETLTPSSVLPQLRDERSATFAVAANPDYGELVAVATINRITHIRFSHRSRLTLVFVDERYRGRGLGEAVVRAAVDCAREWNRVEFVDLCVREDAVPAQRLYARMGFVTWGRQAEATDYRGRRIDEIHMSLRLYGNGNGRGK